MTTNFVLIDYENVQPMELALLRGGTFKVKLFLGANQARFRLLSPQRFTHWGRTPSTCSSNRLVRMHWISTLPTTSAYFPSKTRLRGLTSFPRTPASTH